MQNEYYHIVMAVLALVAVVLAVAIIRITIRAMDNRPDLVALLSLLTIAISMVGLTIPDKTYAILSLVTFITGVLFLFFAAITHNRKLNGGNS